MKGFRKLGDPLFSLGIPARLGIGDRHTAGGDIIAPTVAITSTETSPTISPTATMTITFSEPVTGFVVGDMTISGGSLASFTAVSASVYTVVWTFAAGANTMDIAAGVCTDLSGNANLAATQFSIYAITTLVYDQFTDTNGVLLENHTPNTGGPWVKTTATTGVIDIQTNKASRVSGSAYYHVETGKAGTAGQPVTLSAVLTTGTSACNPGIVFRNENTPTANLFLAYLDDAGNAVKILQYLNGALTIPYTGAVAIVTGTPYTVQVVLEGSAIKVYVDGVLKIDTTDTDHLTATKHGIGILGAAGTADEFTVTG